jgi:hypothetical protein
MGVADKEIQGILRHDDVNTTMNIYVKNVSQSGADAMNALSEKVNLQPNLHQASRAGELNERSKTAKSLQ